MSMLKQELTDYNSFTLAVPDRDIRPQTYKLVVRENDSKKFLFKLSW